MRKQFWVILFGLLLWVALPVHAQNGSWTALLYDPANGGITAVSADGQVMDTFTLPLPQGTDSYPSHAATGHGGDPFAYVAYNSQTYQGVLVVTHRDQIAAQFPLPLTVADSFQFVADESAFSEDNRDVALGYALDGGGWGLIVLDTLTGQVVNSIRSTDPLVGVLGLPESFGLTPTVRRFANRTITFNLIPSGTEGAATYEGYDWSLDTNTLTNNQVYASLDSDTFPLTGEVVMTLTDGRLENQSANFTFFQANSLQVYDPTSGARFPFYNVPDATLSSPHFIQNGELVLVDSSDVNQNYAWRVLGRDGSLIGTLPTAATVNEVRGVADGFIYTTSDFAPGSTTLVYVNTRDGLDAGIPIWTSAANAFPVIAWAGGDALVSAQAAYPAWMQLAPPVYAPGVEAGLAPAPGQPLLVSPGDVQQGGGGSGNTVAPALGVITIGSLATVNTTEGDTLNVRFGPGRTLDVVARVRDGERVTVIDGPRSADGLVWWKIRTAAGIEGWVVESVEDNGTRLQTLIPG